MAYTAYTQTIIKAVLWKAHLTTAAFPWGVVSNTFAPQEELDPKAKTLSAPHRFYQPPILSSHQNGHA